MRRKNTKCTLEDFIVFEKYFFGENETFFALPPIIQEKKEIKKRDK